MASGNGRRRPLGVLCDLLPSALVVAAAVALDAVAAGRHDSPTTGGALEDAALCLSVIGILVVLGLPGAVRHALVRRAGIIQVDGMSGEEFEERLGALFTAMGYAVRRTGQRGDFGADLVVEREGGRAVVQAKRYRGAVGIEAVQQAVGAARYYEAAGAMVVTNSTCTPAARALASANGVELVERDSLVRLLAAHPDGGLGWGALRSFGAQLLEGGRLCVYAAACVVRLAWRLLRLVLRAARAVLRTVG